ncbi:MAG: hypothetical protein K0R98_1967, partial [Rickettsiaceae bacterium]|nr:hypothetical protein [Rickettsiaceae bacterium]
MLKLLLAIFIYICLIFNSAFAGNPFNTSPKDKSLLEKALYFLEKGQLDMAQFEASKASDKDILKLVLWMQYQ